MSMTDEGKEELKDMKTTIDSGMKNENQKDAEVSAGARQRTYTEKGQQYEEQIDKFYTSMKTKCTKITKSVMERESYEQIRTMYSEWMNIYEQFLYLHNQHLYKLPDTGNKKSDYLQNHYQRETYLNNFKTEVQDNLIAQSSELSKQLQRTSYQGSIQGSARSAISTKRLEAEEKRVELEERKRALKKKQELEMAKLALQIKEEELQIETEIAVANAKAEVLNKFEQGDINNVPVFDTKSTIAKTEPKSGIHVESEIEETKFKSKRATTLDPQAGTFIPRNRETSKNVNLDFSNMPAFETHSNPYAFSHQILPPLENDYTPQTTDNSTQDVFRTMIKTLRKPTPEIKKFGGNPLEFRKFLRQFETKVLQNCESDDEKMNYLEQMTFSEANKVVSGYSHLPGKRAYETAMEQLEERYGDSEIIASAFIKKALEWPIIRSGSSFGTVLDEFSIFLIECFHGTDSSVLDYSENIRRLLAKLPFHLHDRWRSVVMRIKESSKSVKFKDFVDFVKKEAKKVNDPTYGSTAIGVFQKTNSQDKDQRRGSQRSKTTYVSCEVTKEQSSISCSYCNTNKHSLDQCFRMMALSRDKRIEHLKGKGHCFGCLKKGHISNQCTRRSRCNKCGRQHPTLLHVDYKIASTTGHGAPAANSTDSNNNNTKPAKDNNRFGEQIVCSQGQLTGVSDVSCAMAIIPVRVSLKNKAKTIETYVFFDSGSSVSFCTEKLMSQLGANGKKQQITINTMGDSQTINTYGINGLQISDLKMECTVELPKVYTKDEMPVSKSHIPTKNEIQKWAHLSHIQIGTIDSDIGIMIGNNVPDAYAPFEIATGPSGSPHATRTRLGWILWNVLRDKSSFEVNRVYLQSEVADDKQLNILMQSFNYDFPERLIEDKRNNSIEDNVFMQQVESSIRFEDEHYYVSLPFRDKDIKLPNNSQQCLQRLRSLRNKFKKDVNFKILYCEFMNKIISKGYAERVPQDEIHRKDGTIWYLPHHGVFHPQKQKIRVVFDCSAKFDGISLNNQLLQGPNLANNLLGVLIRFREEHIAIVGDIESMFYQVKVPASDRDCLRFYWWENGNFENDPLEFRMTVHLFGATSSPSCCNFALQYNANKHRHDFEAKVIETITRNMYVDDCLTSTDTEQKAISLIQDVRTLCQRGGFNLTKWTSNSRTVMESVPEEVRAKDINEWNLSADSISERTLGVHWFILEDKLGFRMNIKNQPSTRRGILSVVSSVYDPIGLASPFVLSAKAILQGLCQTGMSWDEEVSAKDQIRWNNWLQQLQDLETVKIDRCYKSDSCEQIERTELHCFSDASEVGYGVVFYLRIIDKKGNIHCSFVLGKSRVAPLKRVTIPRMELTAATCAVRISQSITSEISLQIDDVYFWTDSMSVLCYISNTKTRFHTFVANRLAVIHDATEVTQWNYVGTKENPADLASRGTTMDKFVRNTQWFNGPDFLWRDSETWSSLEDDENLCISSNDPEVVMKSKTVCTTTETCEGMERLLSYFSSWTKMTKAATWIIQVKERLLNNCLKNRNIVVQHSNIPSVNTMRKAKSDIIAYVQRKHFPDEILALQSVKKGNRNIKTSSKLINLKPFIDSDGILRVGGRLERSDVSYSAKYPIILPKNSVVSKIIIEDIHRSIGHLGKNSILAVLRQNYWILGANGIIKGIVSKCVVCKKYQGSCEKQQMACLPKERLQADDPPFTRVGIDFFGPFEVKQGRSTVKRYGVIFTCLIIRAIHLELAFSLDTDSCINAIRRFIARRGKPQFIRTDNGTNFVSSNKELKDEIKRWNTKQIQDFMLQRQIQWEFNPPSASHFGGVWERLIRSVRKVLYSVMYEQNIRLSDEGLMTLFCEVEGILNNRPITESSEDVNDLEVLTPNHLLLQRQCESFPPGLFHKSDNYVRRRWRQIQYLADLFWTRWRKEYLPLLQCRQKWTKLNRNIKEGDIVLISDNSPRNSWSMGRVQEVIKDRDNVVRVAKVKTANSVLTRPITKLCLVVENDT